jgi:O-acetyl-ADP-ribose deacetylase (regulator of RNase III)
MYIRGDITILEGGDPSSKKLLCHCCNDIGVMGAGVALAIANRFPIVKEEYLKQDKYVLGEVQFVSVTPLLVVANIIGQHGIGRRNNPIRYDALRQGFQTIAKRVTNTLEEVHIPKFIGCGLAGGDYSVVSRLIEEELLFCGVRVFCYEL